MIVTAPGNLLLLGEYAVLEEGGLGLALALARRVVLRVEVARELEIRGSWGGGTVRWTEREPEGSPLFASVAAAVLRHLEAVPPARKAPPPAPRTAPPVGKAAQGLRRLPGAVISVDSAALFQPAGGKSGYGSSAAVAAALSWALLRLAGVEEERLPAAAAAVALEAHRAAQAGAGAEGLARDGGLAESGRAGAPAESGRAGALAGAGVPTEGGRAAALAGAGTLARGAPLPALGRRALPAGGSGYDVLVSCFGGVGLFEGGHSPRFQPRHLPWLPPLYLFRGPRSVSSAAAVSAYAAWRRARPGAARRFLAESNRAVGDFLEAESWAQAEGPFLRCREFGLRLGRELGVPAELDPPGAGLYPWKALGAGNELGVVAGRPGSEAEATGPAAAADLERLAISEEGVRCRP